MADAAAGNIESTVAVQESSQLECPDEEYSRSRGSLSESEALVDASAGIRPDYRYRSKLWAMMK